MSKDWWEWMTEPCVCGDVYSHPDGGDSQCGYCSGAEAMQAEFERLKKEAAEMQLVAGRYQYQFEQAQKCINEIDDMFEYRFKHYNHDEMQQAVRKYLAMYTAAVSKVAALKP